MQDKNENTKQKMRNQFEENNDEENWIKEFIIL